MGWVVGWVGDALFVSRTSGVVERKVEGMRGEERIVRKCHG